MRPSLRVLAVSAGLSLSACVATTSYVTNPYPAPPPVQAEAIPPPPVSEDPLVWQPGHWDWTGTAYVWTGGRWIARAGHGTTWQDGYWANANGAWTWVPAHWM